jgi:hypothetical protein
MMNKLVPWTLAICLGLAAAWLAELYVTGRAENALLRDQLRLVELQSQVIQNQLEAERILDRQQWADALGKAQAPPGQAAGAQPQSGGK